MVQLGRALTDRRWSRRSSALVVYNSNPAAIAPQQNLVWRACPRGPVHGGARAHADRHGATRRLVLPATTQVEHHDVMWSWGQTYVAWNEPAIAPVGEALSNTEIFRRLGRRMGYDDAAFSVSDEAMVEAAVAPLGGDRVAELRERGWIRVDTEDQVLPYADGGFLTPSGKCELFSERLEPDGMDPLPGFTPARERPAGDPTLAARYPLALLTAKGAHHFLNSGYANVDRALKAERRRCSTSTPTTPSLEASWTATRFACSTIGVRSSCRPG